MLWVIPSLAIGSVVGLLVLLLVDFDNRPPIAGA